MATEKKVAKHQDEKRVQTSTCSSSGLDAVTISSFILAILSIFTIICFVLFSFLSFIFDISELGLFLLSFVDNNYVDKLLVYKVASYTENCSLALLEYTLYLIQKIRVKSNDCLITTWVITKS